ncbi:hypothetical protein [Emticicia sp. C21]|uniref:hypothetical protein n=1 Tax=Emticicia sp. C21 TaxID=2302915 RepID=UPI000E3493A2|nr:hypothetical protein [Emticicia sp. C21]RFS16983.1 hypothetical protein D0T08_09915 [Emticicia sp. C21]
MDNTKPFHSLNMIALPPSVYEMYQAQLSKRKGSKEKALAYSGLSRYSYFNVMRGRHAKRSTVQRVVSANLKVIKLFINPETHQA